MEEEGGCAGEMPGMQKLGLPQAEGAGKGTRFLSHRILLGSVLHLSFLLSLFFVFQLEAGGQGRDLKSG